MKLSMTKEGTKLENRPKIEELIEKYKRNSKLSREDGQQAEEIVTKMLLSIDTRHHAFNYMLGVPAKNACNAFVSAIQEEEIDGIELIRGLVEAKEFAGTAGDYRKLELLERFIPFSMEATSILLSDIVKSAGKFGRTKPNSRIVSKLHKKLMTNDALIGLPITELNFSPKETNGLGSILIMGLIKGKKGKSPDTEWIKRHLNWFKGAETKVALGSEVIAEIEKETVNWPEDLQRECLDLGLTKTVTTIIADEDKIKYDNLSGNGLEKEPEKVMTDGASIDIGVFRHLEAIKQHIQILDQQVREKDKKISELIVQQERLRVDNNNLNLDLTRLKEKFGQQEEQKFLLEKKYATASQEAEELREEIKNLKDNQSKEIGRLMIQLDQESEYNLEEFKNMLSQTLKMQYAEFEEVKDEEMTKKLGDHMRYLLSKTFRLLENKGVILKEGE